MNAKTLIVITIFAAVAYPIITVSQPSQDLVNRMMPKPIPSSPNVTSLGKFGDYQVSHFSGLPDISIPIYEVQSGDLKVPITLSYHAGGIKPTDVASWVGLGWSLSAGGQISRTVNGKADEEYYTANALSSNPAVCGPPGTGTFHYLLDAARGVTDSEPDVFSYSFGGRRGKFMLPYNSPPFLVPYAPLKIDPVFGVTRFDITDERGVLHRFGQNALAISCSESTTATNGGNPAYSATTAWHLAEIISPNSDDHIGFSYQNLGTFNTHDISYSYTITEQCYTAYGGACPPNTFLSQKHNNDSYGNQLGLETITFETGKIQFFSTTLRADSIGNLKRLDSIQVQRLDGTVSKTIKFVYSYYTSPLNANAALKLDAIEFKDESGNVVQQYNFEYFTNSFSWSPGNDADLKARDLWGFYNGATTNTDLILPKTVTYRQNMGSPEINLSFGGGTNRNVDIQYLKEGMLKKIIYPTRGFTEFDFESHRYLKDGTPVLVGGLRVSKITSTDGASAPIIKTYKYGDASTTIESGFGLPNFSELQFNYSNTQQYYSGSGCGTFVDVPYSQYQIRSFHSNSAFITDPFDSSPIKYPYVTEYLGDPSGVTNGKTIFEYDYGSPVGDVNHVVPNSGKYFRNSFFWKRGKLTGKTVYDRLDNKLLNTTITYSTFQETSKYVGLGVHHYYPTNYTCTSNICLNEVGEQVPSDGLFFTVFNLSSGVMLASGESQTTFESGDPNKYVSSGTVTTHDATYLQAIISTIIKDDQTQYKTVNRYPFQLTANSSSTGNAKGVYMLINKHILSTPIETYTYVSKGSTENMISAQVTTYRQSESSSDFVLPDQVYLWEPATAVVAKSTYAEMAINGTNDGVSMHEDLKPRIKMISYNTGGDILSARKVNDAPISYQYGYANSLPVAEVTNAVDSRYATSTQGVGSTPITVGGSSPATSSPINFVVDYQGTVRLKLGVSGSPSFTTYVDYSGSLGNGSMTLGTGSCANTEVVFNNVSAGAKTIYVTVRTGTPGTSVGACGQVEYPDIITTQFGFSEFVYENFEEGAITTSPLIAHTGKGYLNGDYTPAFVPPNSRTYVIEYWHWDGAKWIYTSKPYTGISTAVSEGSAIDNVRIYPTDAFMKSYTHDPLLGITSVIDENGIVSYYDYDDFGRLLRIRNDKGYVEKQYSYHYKGN